MSHLSAGSSRLGTEPALSAYLRHLHGLQTERSNSETPSSRLARGAEARRAIREVGERNRRPGLRCGTQSKMFLEASRGRTGLPRSHGRRARCWPWNTNSATNPHPSKRWPRPGSCRQTDVHEAARASAPHRDDVRILIGGRDARLYGSQGQQRTSVIGLKLATMDHPGEHLGMPLFVAGRHSV